MRPPIKKKNIIYIEMCLITLIFDCVLTEEEEEEKKEKKKKRKK
jgi:hypothetical protein